MIDSNEAPVRTNLLKKIAHFIGRVSERQGGEEDNQQNLAAYASHDLRAPWATVHETAVLLADEVVGAVNDQQRKLLAVILERAEAWLRKVDEQVAIPQWVAAGSPLCLQRDNLRDVARQAVDLVKGLTLLRDVTVNVEISEAVPELMVDRHRMVQALTSLLAAAISSSPHGGLVRLSAIRRTETEALVELCGVNRGEGHETTSLARESAGNAGTKAAALIHYRGAWRPALDRKHGNHERKISVDPSPRSQSCFAYFDGATPWRKYLSSMTSPRS